jgi:hypothetical protein
MTDSREELLLLCFGTSSEGGGVGGKIGIEDILDGLYRDFSVGPESLSSLEGAARGEDLRVRFVRGLRGIGREGVATTRSNG